jgi:hypothetical protein
MRVASLPPVVEHGHEHREVFPEEGKKTEFFGWGNGAGSIPNRSQTLMLCIRT